MSESLRTVSGSELTTAALISLYSGPLQGAKVAEAVLPVGVGWESILRRCIFELRSLDGEFTILQIKEKFGGLRFYYTCKASVSEACDWVVRMAEANAGRTCETCGEAGQPSTGSGWWIKTLCPQHATERDIANLDRRLRIVEKYQTESFTIGEDQADDG